MIASWFHFLLLCVVFLSNTCIPSANAELVLRVQQDFTLDRPTIQSYSAIITFETAESDGSRSYADDLNDGQLVNLARVAYSEMIRLAKTRGVPDNKIPSAMIALRVDHRVYFASSLTNSDQFFYSGSSITYRNPRPIEDALITQVLRKCGTGARIHRLGGTCAECNVLDLFFSYHKNEAEAESILKNSENAKGTVWFRPNPGTILESEFSILPCLNREEGWGCETLFSPNDEGGRYPNVKWVPRQKPPDRTGEDGLRFTDELNTRTRQARIGRPNPPEEL
ncbi:MAG: hypothetical protein M1820_001242 [Bogoriella megaspora]|nr:MAG: hypothetical protein M1820_001242 [Bogoriella megaspora]